MEELVNYLDCWETAQEWKKMASDNERCLDLASVIYGIYWSGKSAPMRFHLHS